MSVSVLFLYKMTIYNFHEVGFDGENLSHHIIYNVIKNNTWHVGFSSRLKPKISTGLFQSFYVLKIELLTPQPRRRWCVDIIIRIRLHYPLVFLSWAVNGADSFYIKYGIE